MPKSEETTWITRLTRWRDRLERAIVLEEAPLSAAWIAAGRSGLDEPPPPRGRVSPTDVVEDAPFFVPGPDAPWQPIAEGDAWGREWDTAWFRVEGRIPQAWAGSAVWAHLDLGSEGLVLHADGRLLGGITTASIWEPSFRREFVLLHDRCEGGEAVDLRIEATAASLFGIFTKPDPEREDPDRHGSYTGKVAAVRLARFDAETARLFHDVRLALGLVTTLPAASVRRARLLHAAMRAADHHAGERTRAAAARVILERELHRSAEASALRVAAVGHAHIDTAWLWPIEETVRKCARTFATQVNLLDRYPQYVFGASQAQHYLFVKERHPALFEAIRRHVASGRWEVQGGMWVEADCNLADGESLVRQILHGKNFFRDAFGVDVDNLWLPDVFGYSAALPQILHRAGIDCFLTQKLSWNQWNDFPHTTFRWTGIDGSEVLAHFPPENNYNSPLSAESLLFGAENFRERAYCDEFVSLFGVGDGGGGPREDSIESGMRMADCEGAPRVVFGKTAEFFARLRARAAELPCWQGELYLELHRGTLTSQAAVKAGNRRLEQALRAVEILWSALPLESYPAADLDRLWKTTLLHQFHDILPGSSIRRAYRRTHADHEGALAECASLIEEAGRRLLREDAGTVAVFLPHDRPYAGAVTLPPSFEAGAVAAPGGPIEVQVEDGTPVAAVRVAPFAFTTIRRASGRAPRCAFEAADAHEPLVLENDLVRYELDRCGRIVSGRDKEHGRDFVLPARPANELRLHEDRPNDWDAWDIDRFYEDVPYETPRALIVEVLRAANRSPLPVRDAVRFRLGIGVSTVTQTAWLERDARRLDLRTEVDWRERHRMLRAAFPVAIRAGSAAFEIQYGHIRRPTHENTSWDRARFEVAAHRWVDLSEEDYGVALLNDGKYGHRVRGDTIELNLLRSPTYPDPDCDVGVHRFTYALLPHPERLEASAVPDDAAALNLPPLVLAGASPEAFAYPVRLEGRGLRLAVVKRAEREEDLVIRVVEALGRRARGRLTTHPARGTLVAIDLMEWSDLTAPHDCARPLAFEMGPFEIRTFRWRQR